MLAYTVVTRMRGGSIVLVDEPGLHLHPAIALRLMEAMRAATDAAGGQLWVATHSPEIIDATNLATESLVVLPGGGKGRNVALPITSDDATLGLLEQLGAGVSALAHRRKLVWAEGESDHRLLREFHRDVKRAKFIRAGSKDTVQRASQAVKRAIDEVAHYNFLIAIIDGDRDLALQKIGLGTPTATDPEHGFFVWDRYGIENYLLDAEAILKVHSDLSDARQFASATEVERALKDVADGTLGSLIDSCINARLPRNPLHGATFSRSATPNDLRAAATAYVQRLSKSLPSPDSVATDAHKVCKGVTDLWPEEWRVLCPGKDVLRKFHALHAGKVISYLTYCDYIARAIRDAESWDRRLREVLKAICGPLEDLD